MGFILLILAGVVVFYWFSGVCAPIHNKPAIFRTPLGPAAILVVAVVLTILGLVAL